MPILIAILAAVAGAIWWWARSNPRDAINVADDALTIARNAPRKIAFRRQTKAHPVEGVDDPRLAVATLGAAFIQLDDLPTREMRERLRDITRIIWKLPEEDADEIQSLSAWLIEQCDGPSPAVGRVARRLYKIDGAASWDDFERLVGGITEGNLSERQKGAIQDVRIALHLKV